MELKSKSEISILRSDFEVYKTQVLICGLLIAVVIFILICCLIYVFILLRKLRVNFQEKIDACESKAKFTLDRPKLLHSTAVHQSPFSASNNQQVEVSVPTSFNYKGVEKPKNLQTQQSNYLQTPTSPSSIENFSSVPSSFNYRRAHRPKNLEIPPQDIEVPISASPSNVSVSPFFQYKEPQRSPHLQIPKSDLQAPQSPGSSVNKSDNYKRINESFLNKNRNLYSPKEGDATPKPPELQEPNSK